MAHYLDETLHGPIRLDGLLTEGSWMAAVPVANLTQMEPAEGETATEPTEVRFLFDGEFLYIGIRAVDSSPGRVIGRIMNRDQVMAADPDPVFAGDDAVAVLLDPFHDHRNAYVFATNPNGAELDGFLTDEGREFNLEWRAVWEVAGTRTAEGWSAEMKIPWRSLRYPERGGELWGLNVYRIIRRKNELAIWRSWERDGGGFRRVSLAGHLAGFRELPSPGMNLEVKPFLLGSHRSERDGGAGRLSGEPGFDVGLDLKTEVRPGLVLDLTLNTDFAQVEADDQQVNLTRFDLFFPEKRDFFLENSGIFGFGSTNTAMEASPFQMFFSRRIGIDEEKGSEVPMLGGVRLTGRLGRQTLGFLTATTGGVGREVARETFSVARLKRDVGRNNYLGIMAVDRRSRTAWNTVLGLDGSFFPMRSLNLQAWVAQTFTRGSGGNDLAFAGTATYRTDRWGAYLRHIFVGPEARAQAGFIQRRDLRRSQAVFRRSLRPRWSWVRRMDLIAWSDLKAGTDGKVQDWEVGPSLLLNLESGGTLNVIANVAENRPSEDFLLADTLQVKAGRYDARILTGSLATDPSRRVSAGVNGTLRAFYGGTLRTAGGRLSLAHSPQLSLETSFNRNRVEMRKGAFTADLWSLRGGYAFSTRLFTRILLQYNSLENTLSGYFRVNFIHRPGSDLFLVFSEERGGTLDRWKVADRGMVLKVTYLRRF